MKKSVVVMASVLALSVIGARAEQTGDTNAAPHKGGHGMERPAAQQITVTGTLSKNAWTNNTTGKTMVGYVLTDSEGNKVRIMGRRGPGEQTGVASKLEPFVNAKVKIVGMGFQMERDGKKTTHIREVISVEKVEEQPAAPAQQ